VKRGLRIVALAVALSCAAMPAAAQLVVIDARGGAYKPGATIDGARPISLKAGERLSLIAPDGRNVVLRGPYNGLPFPRVGEARSARDALGALIATRNARSSSIGAVRGGADAAALPDPWLIDISRPGARCLREGETPVWWRPTSTGDQPFVVQPVDRSWRADFVWKDGQDRMSAPRLSKLDGVSLFIIRTGDQDNAIGITMIPQGDYDDVVLASWMLEKGCIQQADAFLKRLQAATGRAE
jgi:hypothetical protein